MKILIVLTVLLFNCAVVGQQCSAVFQFGLYDINAAETSEQQARSFSNWFCSHKSNAQQAGQAFGFKFDNLDINFGGSNSGTTVDDLCGNSSKNEQFQRAFSRFSQTINTAMVSAYRDCIAVKGAHVHLETTSDPELVRFVAIFNPSSRKDPVAEVRSFTVVGGACSPMLKTADEIDVAGRSLLCKRTNAQATITINIELDHTIVDASGELSLPGLPVIKPVLEPSFIDTLLAKQAVFLVTNNKPNRSLCIGSILDNSRYTIIFDPDISGWVGVGPHGDGNCPALNRDLRDDRTYTCANFPTLCNIGPQMHQIQLWGHGFRFKDDGKVFEVLADGQEEEIGLLLKDSKVANKKSGFLIP